MKVIAYVLLTPWIVLLVGSALKRLTARKSSDRFFDPQAVYLDPPDAYVACLPQRRRIVEASRAQDRLADRVVAFPGGRRVH